METLPEVSPSIFAICCKRTPLSHSFPAWLLFFPFRGRVWFLFLTCIACTLSINQARRRAKKYLRRARNNTPMCPSLSIVSLSQGSLTHLLLLRAARKTEKGRSLFERLSLSQSISTATVISSLPTPTLRYIFKWDAQQQPFLLHTRYST